VDYFRLIFALYSPHVALRPSKPPRLHDVLLPGRLAGSIRGGRSEDTSAADVQTFTFADPEKIRELARRGEAWGTSEARQMLEHAIETGRGGCYLRLTPEQYARLRRP
jgi:hypothetical protein